MFDNVGDKIKQDAKNWYAWALLLTILGAITGFFVCIVVEAWGGVFGCAAGGFFLCLSLAPLARLYYGYGVLVCKADEDSESRCPSCGHSIGENDKFCTGCGATLMAEGAPPASVSKVNAANNEAVATTVPVEDAIQQEIRQLSVEELSQRYRQTLQWSKKYRDLCGEELRNRGYYT